MNEETKQETLIDSFIEETKDAGMKASKKLISWVAGLAFTAIIGSSLVLLWPDRQSQIVGVPTWTPSPQVQPAPTRPPVQIVEVQPAISEGEKAILSSLVDLTAAVGNLAAEIYEWRNPPASPAPEQPPVGTYVEIGGLVPIAPETAQEASSALPERQISVWEDGNCWTPPTATVLHLCGADASDGYVIRWVGVPGDNVGPEIPDSDWHAVRGLGDSPVWSGHHPATGEVVAIDYWAGGHVLAVRASGRLLFRIDRKHRIQK